MDTNSFIDLASLNDGSVCVCGRTHTLVTRRILTGSGVIRETGLVARELGLSGKALVVADRNTWQAAGDQAVDALKSAGYDVDTFVFKEGQIHTDEYAVGSVFMALSGDEGFIVAVGSGTVNDCCRFVAKKTGLPYLVVATAPSMDGYASAVAPILWGGFKRTRQGVAPLAVVGDTDVLSRAPLVMMAAGLGDVFGKITAGLDWLMAGRAMGEYRCPRVAGVMMSAVDACIKAAPGLPARDPAAVGGLMNGLVLAGLAMQMVGDSRPASGSEHHVAHFLEMLDLYRGRGSTLHGDKVGLAELIMLTMYERFFSSDSLQALPEEPEEHRMNGMRAGLGGFAELLSGQDCSAIYRDAALKRRVIDSVGSDWTFWQAEVWKLPELRTVGEDLIRRCGGPVRPAELGYSREDTRLALKYAMEIREKFSILRLAQITGRLDGLASELADAFC